MVDQVFNQESTSSSYWLLADHLGTTREVIEDDGTLKRHLEFDAYGRLLSSLGDTRILFAGRELDNLTGMYYVRARWYDPNVGRWISEDPIGFAGQDTNLYRYVANSPVNYTDPSGLLPAEGDSGWDWFLDWLSGTTTSVHPGGPAAGVAGGAGGVTKIALVKVTLTAWKRALVEHGPGSPQEQKALKEYEDAKKKLQKIAPLDGPSWPKSRDPGPSDIPPSAPPPQPRPKIPPPPEPPLPLPPRFNPPPEKSDFDAGAEILVRFLVFHSFDLMGRGTDWANRNWPSP